VSFEIVGVMWRLKPLLIHASCVDDVAGFGEMGEIGENTV